MERFLIFRILRYLVWMRYILEIHFLKILRIRTSHLASGLPGLHSSTELPLLGEVSASTTIQSFRIITTTLLRICLHLVEELGLTTLHFRMDLTRWVARAFCSYLRARNISQPLL